MWVFSTARIAGNSNIPGLAFRGVNARAGRVAGPYPPPTWRERVAAVVISVARCQIANRSASRCSDA